MRRRAILRRGDLRLAAAALATVAFAVLLNQPGSVAKNEPLWIDAQYRPQPYPRTSETPSSDRTASLDFKDANGHVTERPISARPFSFSRTPASTLLPTELPAASRRALPRLASARLYFWSDRAMLLPLLPRDQAASSPVTAEPPQN